MAATLMLVACPSCGKRVSDRAPSCPFCGAVLPAATIDRDATPARGIFPNEGIAPAASGSGGPSARGNPFPLPAPPPAAAPSPPAARPSGDATIVPGPFDRVRPLDGAGRTFLAYFPGTDSAAVVKTLHGDEARFAASAWSSLAANPSVVGALGLLPGGEGVVYEYVAPDAYSRKAQMRSAFERRLRRDPLSFPEVLRLGVLACRGLEHTYLGGLRSHGNLKPSNLLVGLDGGLRVSEPGLPGTESPTHMAPERFDSAPPDERADVYSLGVILYQMAAAGRPPFEAPGTGTGLEQELRLREELRQLHQDGLVPRLDSPLAALLERCLAKAPGGRVLLPTLRAELEDLLRRETGLLPPQPGRAELQGWERAQEGLALLATGRAEPALQAFDEAMASLPPSAAVRSVRATALHVAGRHEEAVASAEAALAIDPQHAPAWRQKGLSLAALQQSDEAASALEQATFLSPRDAAPFVALAGLLGRLGRLPQSLATYDRAVAADPDFVDVWFERGKTLGEAGEKADAAAALLRFLDLAAASHPARRKAEELLQAARENAPSAGAPAHDEAAAAPPLSTSAEAEATASEGNRVDSAPAEEPSPASSAEPAMIPEEAEPRDPAAWSAHGVSLFRAGRLEEALDAFDHAIAGDKRNPSHWANRASVLFRLARPTEGLAGHVRALALEPRLASSWLNKATIERSLGRAEDAARSLREVLDQDPPAEPRVASQARSLLAELEQQGVEPAPRGALGFLAAGLREAEAGRLEEAAQSFENALSRDPLLPLAWLYRGDSLAHLGRVTEAATAYEEGLAADPSDARLLLGFGRSRARLGDLDAATAVLKRCLEVARGEERVAAERLLRAVESRRTAAAPPAPAAPVAPPEPEPEPPAPPAVPADPAMASEPAFPEPAATETAPAPFDPDKRIHLEFPAVGLQEPDAPEPAAPVPATEEPTREAAVPEPEPSPPLAEPMPPEPEAAARPPAAPSVAPAPAPVSEPAPRAAVMSADPVAEGAALVAKGRAAEALDLVEQAIAAGNDDPRLLLVRGDSLRALGRRDESTASFEEALKRAPSDPQAWVKKAETLDAAGAYAEAAAAYGTAVELHPRHIGAWNSRGVALTRIGKMEDALGCFTRALDLDPRFALARFNRGAAEDVLGRHEDACKSFETFLSSAPANLRAQIQHAQKRLAALQAPRG